MVGITMFPTYDPVCVLLETPFSRWNEIDKRGLLKSNKPSPILSFNKLTKIKDKVYNRNFRPSWYANFEWLCGSYYLNKLFCLPCLTIPIKSSVWNKSGFCDFGNVTRALHKHESSSEHMRCALTFSKWRKNLSTIENAVRENSRLCVKYFNENVKLNRRFMHLPIRAVIYLSKQELPFRDHREDASPSNGGNFKELLDTFIVISPVDIQEHYKKIAPMFAEHYQTIQNDLIDCISEYIDEYVEQEIKKSVFFSLQVDDWTDILQSSQCSLIIRCVNAGGKLVERFLGFYDVTSTRTAETIFNLVSESMEKFDYKTKMVGQCFDGASVMSGQLDGLQAQIKAVAPQAVFVHSMAHRLSLVLQQGCNNILKCRLFFATVNGLPTFFHDSAQRIQAIVGKGINTSAIARWSSKSKILSIICNEWDSLKEVLDQILNNPSADEATVRESEGFFQKFHDFEFAFLAVAFDDIFKLTDALYDVLQNHSFDIDFCLSEVANLQQLLNERKNEDTATAIFESAASRTDVPTEDYDGGTRIKLPPDEAFEKYKILWYEILDTLSLQITTRFQDMNKLRFVTLMNTFKFAAYANEFPTESLNNLKMYYPNMFTDLNRLKNELKLIYNDEEDKYKDTQLQHFVSQLTEDRDIFKEAYKLLCLITTIPSTSVSAEGSFSCLKRVNAYVRNTMAQDRLTSLAKISIEKELLDELINAQPFYEDIIDKFARLEDRSIDLLYKK